MVENLEFYYKKRAKEYDKVYEKPERQQDLQQLHEYLKTAFANKEIFEIACGTGYWTKTIAQTCLSILAIDINESVLEIARARNYGETPVDFQMLDLWQLKMAAKPYDAVFGGFIWSHILKDELPRFLGILQKHLKTIGELIFIDNKYVEGSSTPIARTDEQGNTYQIRRLQNGEEYEVLKNFPTKTEVARLVTLFDWEMEWEELEYFWILKLRQSR